MVTKRISNPFYLVLLLLCLQSSRAQVALEDSFASSQDEINRYQTKINGFSGLIFDETGKGFYAVSDYGRIERLDFQGKIVENLYKKGGDLEGITMDPHTSTLYVVDEKKMRVLNSIEQKKNWKQSSK